MWTCLYLSHIVVIIMIIIAILGIIYGISQKKIKVYQVIVIFLFCVISMALVTGVTSMQCIDDLNSEISGDVDIIAVPFIEVGNALGKSLTYLAGATSAGIIMGAKVPIVLVSRADDYETKLYSIALGSHIASKCK